MNLDEKVDVKENKIYKLEHIEFILEYIIVYYNYTQEDKIMSCRLGNCVFKTGYNEQIDATVKLPKENRRSS